MTDCLDCLRNPVTEVKGKLYCLKCYFELMRERAK